MPIADLLFLLLALLLGALMSRTSLCTVAGIKEVVQGQSWSGMWRILAASSAAGCVLLACFMLLPSAVQLPRAQPIGVSLLIGGALLGMGALINGACYLGSVLYLGRGNINYLFTLLGLALVARAASAVSAGPVTTAPVASPSPPVLTPLSGLVIFALLLAVALAMASRMSQVPNNRTQRMPLLVAAATGACASLVNALHPGWSYGVVIDSLARHRQGMWLGLMAALLLFAGACLGALWQHKFGFASFRIVPATRCLCGGLVMGYGAQQIPGGNDSLLLWAIPGLTLYGLIAYAVMACIIAAAFFVSRQR